MRVLWYALPFMRGDEMVVIHWEVNETTGHGGPVEYLIGKAWVEYQNSRYGARTHWLVRY